MTSLRSREPVPLDTVVENEQSAQVRGFLAELSEPDREILTLRYTMDYGSAEIADILNINTAAVHMRLSRARQRLAERLAAQGVVAE